MGTAVMQYDVARVALAKARTLDEVKRIADQSEALKHLARQAKDSEMLRWMAEIRIRALRRIGEMTRVLETSSPGPANRDRSDVGRISKGRTLAAADISRQDASRAELIASIDEAPFEALLGELAEKKCAATTKLFIALAEKATSAPAANPTAFCESSDLEALVARDIRFGTLYVDPPWHYGNQGTRAATDNHYETMTVDEIATLPVEKLAADKAHLHLWTTNAFLPDSFRVMEAWGFEYKSVFLWVKPELGIGNYWRVSHEFLVLGTRGLAQFLKPGPRSWFEASRRGLAHSQKPAAFRDAIERVSPGPRLELFAREVNEGWVAWGNQIRRGLFDQSVEEIAA